MSEKEITIKKFEPKFDSIDEVYKTIDGKTIDLRKTIEKVLSKDIGINPDCVVEAEDCGWEFSELGIELHTDEFYNKLEEFKNDGKWMCIHAVYATPETSGTENVLYEYEVEDDDEEYDYDYVTVGISSCVGDYDLMVNSEYYTGDDTSDYAIVIENGEITFELYCGGMFASYDYISDLSEPVHELAIELMLDMIVFKD